MSEVPTLKEELERKAVDTLAKMESDLEAGRITPAQYGYGVDLLWSSWAGLVSSDVMVFLEMMNAKREPPETRHYFYRGDGELTIATDFYDGRLTVEAIKPGEIPDVRNINRSEDINPHGAIIQVINKLRGALQARGFNEV